MEVSRYQDLQDQLGAARVDADAAELHGVVCGLLCAGCRDAKQQWFNEMFNDCDDSDVMVADCRRSLDELADQTIADLNDPGLRFSPFLPEEPQTLSLRAAALRDWCHGFLYGLGLAGDFGQRLSEVGREALTDLAEISRMEAVGTDASEEDEAAYTEVAEFVRVAAMLIREELDTGNEVCE